MHIDAYLAPCPGYGWDGTPRFKTTVDVLQNGDEYRNAEWAEARHEYSAPFLNISKDSYREIKRMFLSCRGMLHAFRFRDELDYEATAEQFGTGDGVETEFQLNKVSTTDGVEYVRNVYALKLGADPVLTVNGTPTTAFSYNNRTGVVLFDVAPAAAAVLRWTGEFDIWVRFATDTIPFSLDDPDATNGLLSLIEVPAPDEPVTP
jgi:uncharacterized protein (TIGR02217 family)